eukprot:GHVU01131869.1.p1 GENE.GHVU01131869.1~~GHVU01131869.1.p1  ORF type:complete len:150 (-),score=1.50 GHVU01131869.1:766-1215(-)
MASHSQGSQLLGSTELACAVTEANANGEYASQNKDLKHGRRPARAPRREGNVLTLEAATRRLSVCVSLRKFCWRRVLQIKWRPVTFEPEVPFWPRQSVDEHFASAPFGVSLNNPCQFTILVRDEDGVGVVATPSNPLQRSIRISAACHD